MAPRCPAESVARARTRQTHIPYRACMAFVSWAIDGRTEYGLADAVSGWRHGLDKRTSPDPPAGVPVYWSGGLAAPTYRVGDVDDVGHAALSIGGGRAIGTDWPRLGLVGEHGIEELTQAWGLTLLGWTADFAGRPIPGVDSDLPGAGWSRVRTTPLTRRRT